MGLPPVGKVKGAGHIQDTGSITDEVTINLREAVEHKTEHSPPVTFVWKRDGKDMRVLKPPDAGVTMHPLGAGSGVAVVGDDGQLLRPAGMDCSFPAPDIVQGAQALPNQTNPDPSSVTPETVDINIPKQLVEMLGFDHPGFGEVTVEV